MKKSRKANTENVGSQKHGRDEVLDMLKGIAIISMVVGHAPESIPFVTKWAYSFHMPLFFMLGGYLFKPTPIFAGMRKDAARFVLPYLVFAAVTVAVWFAYRFEFTADGLASGAQAILWGAAWWHISPVWGKMEPIGALWFLLALFWTRTAFNVVYNIVKRFSMRWECWLVGIICVLLSWAAVIVDHRIVNLPFGILAGIGSVFYFFFGYAIRRFDLFGRMNGWWALVCAIVWVLAVKIDWLAIAVLEYGRFPWLTSAGALAAVMVLYWICSKIRLRWLADVGFVSLSVLCVHHLMLALNFRRLISLPFNWAQILLEFAVIAAGIFILSQIPWMRKVLALPEMRWP